MCSGVILRAVPVDKLNYHRALIALPICWYALVGFLFQSIACLHFADLPTEMSSSTAAATAAAETAAESNTANVLSTLFVRLALFNLLSRLSLRSIIPIG